MAKQDHPNQINLDGIPNALGRPKTGAAKTAAERQKMYRLKKKKQNQVEIRRFLSEKSAFHLETLESKGMTLEELIALGMDIRFGEKQKHFKP